MNIPALIFFIIGIICEIAIIVDIISGSKKKVLKAFLSVLLCAASFILVYFILTLPIIRTIAIYILSIYGGVLLLTFIIGHIVIFIKPSAGEKIVAFFHTALLWLIPVIILCLPPLALYVALGLLK